MIHDQHASFTGNAYIKFCEKYNIELHAIASGSSRGNAQVEVMMKQITNLITVGQYLTKQSIKQLMPQVQLVLNSTVNTTTKFAPIQLPSARNP